jgi:hypothetical protein
MTEAEWLACTGPRKMLEFLQGKGRARKLRLFACACCRLVWHLLPGRCHRLVEAVEQYPDKATAPSDLATLFDGYHAHQVAVATLPGGNQAAEAVGHLGSQYQWGTNSPEWQDWYTPWHVARSAAESLAKTISWDEARQQEGQLLHDIFGSLAFRPVTLDPDWLTSNVKTLAQAIYDDRSFSGLPILADALEEAGCTNADLLHHCHRPAEHVRGCWVVDLVLGKK